MVGQGNLGGITSHTTLNTVKENGIVSINGAPTVTMGSIRNTNPDLKWRLVQHLISVLT